MQIDTSQRTVIEADPVTSRVDEPIHLTVSGLPPGQPVTIRATTSDGSLRPWASSASFLAGDDGTVDVSAAAPVSGTYSGVDAGGLLWSMVPAGDRHPTFFVRRKAAPLRVHVSVEAAGNNLAACDLERTFGGETVGRRAAGAPGLAGDLFFPLTGGPHPGVMIVSGSDGGQLDHAASLLAAHGYAVLSLGYCGVEDRPTLLHRIDLRYFEKALDWMAAQPEVAGDRATVVGLSRGGELALQLGSMFPRVAGVVAGSPSGIRQAGLTKNTSDFTKPAWVDGTATLPYLAARMDLRRFLLLYSVFLLRRPLRLRPVFERLLRRRDDVAAATIEVERIAGPVLLVSGTADELWPSFRFGELIMGRLREAGHPYADEHLTYEGAGHFTCFPYALPSLPPMTRMSPIPRFTMDFGGTAAANAAAARDSWPEILRFLAAIP